MYEKTLESIKSDILSGISTNVDTREGSFTNDMVSAIAYETWNLYHSLDALVPIAFVDKTSGEYIDKRCAKYGMTRKTGTKASAVMNFTGTNGTMIPVSTVFLTEDGLEFETETAASIMSGTASATAKAVEVGEQYNVASGAITQQIVSISGLSTITNEAAVGGTDAETDAALVARLYSFLQKPATSGNAYHYEQWALAVDGVGAVKVTPLANGAGTVGVLIVGNDKEPVDSSVVECCQTYIDESRPIGATVTVASAAGLAIHVAATVTIDSTTTTAAVQAAFTTALEAYLKSIAFSKYELIYNRVAYMLLDIDGVINYTSLTINGGTSNITIGESQVPVLGSVEVS